MLGCVKISVLLFVVLLQAPSLTTVQAVTTSKVLLSKSTFTTRPVAAAVTNRTNALDSLLATTLAAWTKQCTPTKKCPQIVLNAGKASGATTVVKGSSILVTKGKSNTVSRATLATQASATLSVPAGTGLTIYQTDFKTLASSWLLVTSSSLAITEAPWTAVSARLIRFNNASLTVSKADVNINGSTILSMGSAWKFSDSSVIISWSKPLVPTAPASASRPVRFVSSTLSQTNGRLNLVNIPDFHAYASTLNFFNCDVNLVNSEAYIVKSKVNFNNMRITLVNSKLTLSGVTLVTDKYLRTIFSVQGLPKISTPPFPALDKVAAVTATAQAGNFSLSSQATW